MAQNQLVSLGSKSYSSSNTNINSILKELKPMDYIKYFALFIAYVNIWILKAFTDFISSSSLSAWSENGTSSDKGTVGDSMLYGDISRQDRVASSSSLAIGRVLSHILQILNEIPATSKKYDQLVSMADKIIEDNLPDSHTCLHDTTRSVLLSAFSTTCKLLRHSLHKSKSSQFTKWPSRLLQLLPFGPHLATGYDTVCLSIHSLANNTRHHNNFGNCSDELLVAEKLANELLWIVNKMRSCSMNREAIVKWGYEWSIASLVVVAHPRVQGPIVQISALLINDLAGGEWEVEREVKYKMLVTWLPTLCYTGNGLTLNSHVLTRGERVDMERRIEQLISSLPNEDQEVILRRWVENFARSDSNWPDVHKCFDQWCQNSRKFFY